MNHNTIVLEVSTLEPGWQDFIESYYRMQEVMCHHDIIIKKIVELHSCSNSKVSWHLWHLTKCLPLLRFDHICCQNLKRTGLSTFEIGNDISNNFNYFNSKFEYCSFVSKAIKKLLNEFTYNLMMMMMIMMMNCFCSMIDRESVCSLISSWDHCQKFSPSQISNTLQPESEPTPNLSSGFVEWNCTVVIIITPQCHYTW